MKRKYLQFKTTANSVLDPKYDATTPIDTPHSVTFHHKFSPVRNQNDLGICTGYAIVAAAEYLENVERLDFVRLSETFVYFNERLLEGHVREDSGADIRDGIRVIAEYGICEEAVWPADNSRFKRKPTDEAYENAKKHRVIRHHRIDQAEEALIHCLATRTPIVFGIMVYESFESDEVAASGIVPMPIVTEECLGGHAVVICGYDRIKRRFFVRNSWGAEWGIDGYFWLPFDYVLNPKLADSFFAISKIT